LPKNYSFTVEANQIWTDTGLDLDQGDRLHVSGAVIACEGPSPSEKAHLPLPSAPGGALLVKLHAEATPIPAAPDADLPIVGPSHLYLGAIAGTVTGPFPRVCTWSGINLRPTPRNFREGF
jgi:hypothetical protein